MPRRAFRCSRAGAALWLGVAATAVARVPDAEAQTNERIYEQLDFRAVTPGARAVGMGKAFVGLADDATAAFSNPAGLSNLFQQEFSVEFQRTRYKHERLVSLNPGDPVRSQVFGDMVLIPSFFSYALPLGRSTLSLFANRVQDYRETFEFRGRPIGNILEDGAFGEISVQADNFGLGYSYVLSRHLSLGGTFVVSNIRVDTMGRSGTPLNPRNGTDTSDSGTTVAGIGGVLVKPLPGLSLGAVYYAGSKYRLQTRVSGLFLDTTEGLRNVPVDEIRDIDYVVPGRFAFGGALRLGERVTVLADLSRVFYSNQITDRFLIVDFMDPAAGLTRDDFFIEDVWELHAGVEARHYLPGFTFALRAGAFTDPDHQLRFRPGRNGNDHFSQSRLDFRFNTLPSETDVGFTFGGGVAIKNKLQIDVAASFAEDADEIVLSLVIKP